MPREALPRALTPIHGVIFATPQFFIIQGQCLSIQAIASDPRDAQGLGAAGVIGIDLGIGDHAILTRGLIIFRLLSRIFGMSALALTATVILAAINEMGWLPPSQTAFQYARKAVLEGTLWKGRRP